MGLRIRVFLVCLSIQFLIIAAMTNVKDVAVLNALKDVWDNEPPSWQGTDPCGDAWEGVRCIDTSVISIALSGVGLSGILSGDITSLSGLQTLDLSYNSGLSGPLPSNIGDLKSLTNLILVGCSFSGPIPDSIGSLTKLVYLSLNSNSFTGRIPPSIGNLTELFWLDLTDNKLTGTIPVSDGISPGLDMLASHTKHFHLGKNQLSGTIPEKLFSPNMVLIHVVLDSNNLTGELPSSLGLVKPLEVVRFSRNQLSGPVPSSLKNLTSVQELLLSNNELSGPMPNLAGMDRLSNLDMSNNSFDASGVPSWVSKLQSLTTLKMENTNLRGPVPSDVFSLPNLQTVDMRSNNLNGSLDIGTPNSDQLQLIDLGSNLITDYKISVHASNVDIILAHNPICQESGATYYFCTDKQQNISYSTPPPPNCMSASCSLDQISNSTCQCAYPFKGTLVFTAPSIEDWENDSNYKKLEQSFIISFQSYNLPVDSIYLSNIHKDSTEQLNLSIKVVPSGEDRFNRTGISSIGFVFSSRSYNPPLEFGLYYLFHADPYHPFAGESRSHKSTNIIIIIIGAAVGGCVLLLLLLLGGVYAHRQRRRAEKAIEQNPFAHWDLNKSSGSIPQLKGARCFSFEEVMKYTNHFSEATVIGSGGYGKVYRGTLPTGELVAIKRAQQGSMQSGQQFKNEIELLSRVHHKNLVSLYGFCFERGEQMLIYEYVPNGSLRDSLSGKTGVRMDWIRRLKIALGAARGLAYLHEHANPPIIHRDVKASNILLDERLNAKVADFGLSKLMSDSERSHVSTQVKGTMGYLDPEYNITEQLTEKSDVYSFGVLMLELMTGRKPIERGKYIVREVKTAMDKNKDLYNLYELLDPNIGLGTTLKGFDKFVDLAMRCVQDTRDDRPTMGEVVKEIENILQLAGLNPNSESASTSASYDDASKRDLKHQYGNSDENFEYSCALPLSMTEPL